jgi:signal transduction histidine kinase
MSCIDHAERAPAALSTGGFAPVRPHLLAVVAHELRQPLSTGIMAADLLTDLLEAGTSMDALRRHLGLVDRCMRQTLRLADDLLALGRAESGALRLRRAPTDVAALLDEASGFVALAAMAKRVVVHVVPPGALPRPAADRHRIQQVLANVCGNAVKFTPEGGRVTLGALAVPDAVEISVTDSGPGVAPDELPRLFDPFYQVGDAGGGTGLGLAIAKWLVEAHGGRIAARPADGGGLVVAFTIPLDSA